LWRRECAPIYAYMTQAAAKETAEKSV